MVAKEKLTDYRPIERALIRYFEERGARCEEHRGERYVAIATVDVLRPDGFRAKETGIQTPIIRLSDLAEHLLVEVLK